MALKAHLAMQKNLESSSSQGPSVKRQPESLYKELKMKKYQICQQSLIVFSKIETHFTFGRKELTRSN